jgi:hypothetical protein
MVYLITWDLNKEGYNYSITRERLLNLLSKYDRINDPGLDSVYFIHTYDSPNQIYNHLSLAFDKNDRLIITRLIKDTHQGLLDPKIWNWINARL